MPKEGQEWTITLDSFNGFVPAWFDNAYPFYGNKSQAASMIDIDITDPNVLTQGPGTADLTSGTQTGELGSELIIAILKHATASNVTYGCSNDKVFKITNTAVSNGNYPKTIAAGTANVATDLLYYKSKVLVFWNDTGVDGDIGLLTNDTTWDDNWGSTVATGAAQLQDAPHYGINGGDDVAYITNGIYIATVDGITLNATALDFWTDSQTQSVTWNGNRVLIALNRPNVTGANFNMSGIYKWNGVSSSWEGDPIEVAGEIGALYTKNGVTFVWWADATTTGGYTLGYIDGLRLKPLRRYTGSLPNQTQVCEWKGFLAWVSSSKIYLWGARDTDIPVGISQYMSGKRATIGAISAPFGNLYVSSTASTNYNISKNSGYATTARWNTRAFNVSGPGYNSIIDLIEVQFETLATGAKVDTTLTYNQGALTQSLTQIAYSATDSTTIRKILNKSPVLNDFRLDFSWANGSTTNPVKIRSIFIKGHYV